MADFKGALNPPVPSREVLPILERIMRTGVRGFPEPISRMLVATTASADTELVEPRVGFRIVVTEIGAVCDNANTVDVAIVTGFSARGSVETPTIGGDEVFVDDMLLNHPGIAPGSGLIRGNGSGIIGIGQTGEGLYQDVQVPTGGSIRTQYTFYYVEG